MKLHVGDVFNIKLSEEEFGFGQIIALPNKSYLIICVFNYKQAAGKENDLQKICNSEIIFLGYTLDAKLYKKSWVVVGNYKDNLDSIALPYNKLGLPPGATITDWAGKKVRDCSPEEFEKLSYQKVIAPVRYENAIKAYYKLQPWIDEDYNSILYENTLSAKELVEKNIVR